jgi:hypothetical protein
MAPACRWAWLAALAAPVVAGEVSSLPSLETWTTKYDVHLRKHAKHYFGPNLDWRWFKAQAVVESGLKPVARGRSGSRGIMQLKPSTFAALKKKEPRLLNIEDPRWNIAAAIFYDRLLFDQWDDRRPLLNRLSFTFASYNAGLSRIQGSAQRARKRGQSDGEWAKVSAHAPAVTRDYVGRIVGLMRQAPPSKAPPARRGRNRGRGVRGGRGPLGEGAGEERGLARIWPPIPSMAGLQPSHGQHGKRGAATDERGAGAVLAQRSEAPVHLNAHDVRVCVVPADEPIAARTQGVDAGVIDEEMSV